MLNGLLDVNTTLLVPHSPEFLSPIQLPMNFDPAERCPHWDDFWPPRSRPTPRQSPGRSRPG